MVGVRRDLWRSTKQCQAGHQETVAQNSVQVAPEYLQGWRHMYEKTLYFRSCFPNTSTSAPGRHYVEVILTIVQRTSFSIFHNKTHLWGSGEGTKNKDVLNVGGENIFCKLKSKFFERNCKVSIPKLMDNKGSV